MYRTIDAAAVVATSVALTRRIAERFPDSGLSDVAAELEALARDSADHIAVLVRPHWPLRLAIGAGLAVLLASIAGLLLSQRVPLHIGGVIELLQALEAAVNDVVFIALAVFFLLTAEARLKRRRVLRQLQELRSLAHVIDMHQLTKDPERVLGPYVATPSSPVRELDRFGLARYLDYCSELLAITSKLAALYLEHLDDALVLSAVNDIQSLCNGLSNKIWQKIMILDTLAVRGADDAPRPQA